MSEGSLELLAGDDEFEYILCIAKRGEVPLLLCASVTAQCALHVAPVLLLYALPTSESTRLSRIHSPACSVRGVYFHHASEVVRG